MKKFCLICKSDFNVPKCRYNSAKYCSLNCRKISQKTNLNPQRKRVSLNCLHCNMRFTKISSSNKVYCSKECYWGYRNDNPEIKFQSNQTDNRFDKKCDNCGVNYKVYKYRGNSKFCSVQCHDDLRRETLICPSCENEFISPKHEKRVYCSEKCSTKGVLKRKSRFFKSVYNFLDSKYECDDEILIKGSNFKYFGDIHLKKK